MWPLEKKRVLLRFFCADAEILSSDLCALLRFIHVLFWFCRAPKGSAVFQTFIATGGNIDLSGLASLLNGGRERVVGGFATVFVVIHSRVGMGSWGRAEGLLRDSLASLDSLALLENKKAYTELVALERWGRGGEGRQEGCRWVCSCLLPDAASAVYHLQKICSLICQNVRFLQLAHKGRAAENTQVKCSNRRRM